MCRFQFDDVRRCQTATGGLLPVRCCFTTEGRLPDALMPGSTAIGGIFADTAASSTTISSPPAAVVRFQADPFQSDA